MNILLTARILPPSLFITATGLANRMHFRCTQLNDLMPAVRELLTDETAWIRRGQINGVYYL